MKFGDGNQIRSFLYIDDCIRGIDLLFKVNLRSYKYWKCQHVTINELVNILEEISGHKVKRVYDTTKPKELTQDQAIILL